jgi:L-aminopeptidase/D-esterase-like protein
VPGIKVGHFTDTRRPTGCTAILFDSAFAAGVDYNGSAPGESQVVMLQPVSPVERIHALFLTGGGVLALPAAGGVLRYLGERNIGFDWGTPDVRIPIVVSAVIDDLAVGNARIRPDENAAYKACDAASTAAVAEGNVGAGAGATVGKIAGMERAMKAGIGSAALALPDGTIVAAIVAVNAVGDVIDPSTGRVVAGVRTPDGRGLSDARQLLRLGTLAPQPAARGEQTTIGVVATNVRLTKTEATKMAQMAHDGLARAIAPVHTPADGDTIFALASGSHESETPFTVVGALAAEVMADAIVRAARQAAGLPGLPAARDLEPGRRR